MSRTYIWPVSGMHCASCERVIGDALKKIPGVEEVDVRLQKQKAGIRMMDGAPEPDLDAVNASLASLGYRIGDTASASATCAMPKTKLPLKRRLLEASVSVLLVGLALSLFVAPLLRLVPSISIGSSLGALFALGLVASVSTCLAANGAFLLAYVAEGRTPGKALWIQVGRVGAFAIGGGILGAIGGVFQSSGWMYGLIALALGVGFAAVGLHLMDIAPSLASLGIRMPRRVNDVADRLTKGRSRVTPLLVGAVTFILPCGFTQTAQALALASGSAMRGSLLMFFFALGTMPVLYGITQFGSAATLAHRGVRLATGAMLFLFAFGQLDGGLTVLGSPVTFGGMASQIATAVATHVEPTPAQAQEQIVEMTVEYGAFTPNRFTIKRGVPVRWDIRGNDISGCASSIVSPKLGLSQSLVPGMNVIRFTPTNKGTIPFSCSMGMIRGSFTVVD